jgi:hypothetical protein
MQKQKDIQNQNVKEQTLKDEIEWFLNLTKVYTYFPRKDKQGKITLEYESK